MSFGQNVVDSITNNEIMWENLKPAVFKYSTKNDFKFSKTLRYFVSGTLVDKKWHYYAKNTATKDFSSRSAANILIEGNCSSKIELKNGGMIHIKGDLIGEINVKGHSEIIIAGGISKEALIKTDGICSVIIGTNVKGSIINSGSSTLIVKGNLDGYFVSGNPSTDIHVEGDCNATFEINSGEGGLFYFIVEGYMPYKNIISMQKLKFTRVNAYIEESNIIQGVIPSYNSGDIYFINKKR